MKIFAGNKVPIISWCDNPEEGAVNQARNLAKLPFVFKQVCLMPDTHQGYGMPIGGVIATKGVIIPNAVGVDIGCGMCAVKTSLTNITPEQIKKIFGGSKDYHGGIRSIVPVGFSHHSKKQDESLMPNIEWVSRFDKNVTIVEQEYDSALKQLGTLGGGNHFIEIQQEVINCSECEGLGYDSERDIKLISPKNSQCPQCKGTGEIKGNIWIMIHSGSRNLGYKVAKHYNKLAQKLCKQWYSNIPEFKGEDGLAFLPLDSEEGQMYLREMNYCVDFALANRELMMARIKEIFKKELHKEFSDNYWLYDNLINIAHNYASLENHFGQNVMVHRKGATLARDNTIGIIPGSQGTSSYIVKGKGNKESFESCSHGAGRKMSRTKARKTLNLEEEIKNMNDKGIIHGIRTQKELDESASAYKDIDVVMEEQKDLVEILVKLKPLGVIKG